MASSIASSPVRARFETCYKSRDLSVAIPRFLDGRFQKLDLIGYGAMAEVYKAWDTASKQTVAIKVMDLRVGNFQEIFESEVSAIKSLPVDPRLPKLTEVGGFDGCGIIVMDLAEGATLNEIIDERIRIPALESLEIISQIVKGLAVAAKAGIYHKDIKPENIVIQKDGTVKILDWGISKYVALPGFIFGTKTYMALEQLQGAEIDHRADIHALGILLYTMIAGKSPYSAEATILDIWESRELGQIPSIPEYEEHAPPAVKELISKITAKKKEDRHQTYEELLAEIETIKEQLQEAEGRMADLTELAELSTKLFNQKVESFRSEIESLRSETEPTREFIFTPNGTRIMVLDEQEEAIKQ